ncbi:unnamed protein product, partial [Mesorhabditis spiculigera]
MCAIEKITSKTKKIKIKQESGKLVAAGNQPDQQEEYEEVRVWNPTVANLTLMALGSSAPEILLSIIEIVGNNFHSGDLGPGTIVGSAAFNLFCISAICVLTVGKKTKRIALFKVFCVTAFFGTFAYIWLLIVLAWISPDVVELWEAILTLLFFGILVIASYCVDLEIWNKNKKANLETELQDIEDRTSKKPSKNLDVEIRNVARRLSYVDGESVLDALPAPEEGDVRKMARDVARVYPGLEADDQAKILAYRLNQNKVRDRLYYRIRAIRQLTSSWKKTDEEKEVQELEEKEAVSPDHTSQKLKPRIEFTARVYAVYPQDKKVKLSVIRRGNSDTALTLNYSTVDGIGKKDLHYLPKMENLRFAPQEMQKDIVIDLVDGADWRPNTVFYVHLKIVDQDEGGKTKLGECNIAHVKCPEDTTSFSGTPNVEFVKGNYVCKENCGWVRVFITKRGKTKTPHDVGVRFETEDISANANEDYVPYKNALLYFKGQEYEKYIDVEVVDDKDDEKDETFSVELLGTEDRETTIGNKKRTIVTIISDDNVLKNITNTRKLVGYYLKRMTPGQATWREQIINAASVNSGDVANATVLDCVLHGLAFPWKFAFAFVPPPMMMGGWLCFVVALIAIGLVTAVVGDIASIFGCMVGMPDAITAITLVALGTSLPDTFASKIAAENDDFADNAVGNVTGSNSVNVFLGLGLPWLVAAFYWCDKGQPFVVKAGDLGFSVAVFTIFSIIFLIVLIARRMLAVFGKGELGGPPVL